MQLAIDTSTDTTSLALIQESGVLTELTWRCEQNHSVELLPHLVDLLRQAGTSLQSLTGIIVARGPGSFNALRVGVSTAKGLAFSLGIPIVGISTLEAEAYQHNETGGSLPAQRNRFAYLPHIQRQQRGNRHRHLPDEKQPVAANYR